MSRNTVTAGAWGSAIAARRAVLPQSHLVAGIVEDDLIEIDLREEYSTAVEGQQVFRLHGRERAPVEAFAVVTDCNLERLWGQPGSDPHGAAGGVALTALFRDELREAPFLNGLILLLEADAQVPVLDGVGDALLDPDLQVEDVFLRQKARELESDLVDDRKEGRIRSGHHEVLRFLDEQGRE